MEQKFSEDLKKVMALVASNAPQDQLTIEINNLKLDITRSIKESQRILNLLDAIAEHFNIRPPIPPVEKKTILPSTFILSKDQMFEIATRSAKDGIIDTKALVPELRRMGDIRSERGILIGMGNILFQRGWQKVDNCKYLKPETQKLMEVK